MTTCCKREDSETIPTCRSNESDARDGAENEMKCATSDINTEERCSGEMCDGMAFKCPLYVQTNTDALIKKSAYRLPPLSSVELLATRNSTRVSPYSTYSARMIIVQLTHCQPLNAVMWTTLAITKQSHLTCPTSMCNAKSRLTSTVMTRTTVTSGTPAQAISALPLRGTRASWSRPYVSARRSRPNIFYLAAVMRSQSTSRTATRIAYQVIPHQARRSSACLTGKSCSAKPPRRSLNAVESQQCSLLPQSLQANVLRASRSARAKNSQLIRAVVALITQGHGVRASFPATLRKPLRPTLRNSQVISSRSRSLLPEWIVPAVAT